VGNATGSGLTQSFDFDGDGDPTSDSNSGETDDFQGSCGSSGGTDVAFMWEAPTDGCYQFDTNGSSYDTVLRIFDECGGTEQECNDDGGISTQSLVETSVASGERVVVVIDGYSSLSAGNYELNITTAASSSFTEDLDLGTASGDAVATDDNTGLGDTVSGICTFGGTGEDIVYLWEAPSTECWIFDSEGSSIDTYITLIDTSNLCYEQTVCDTASAADGTNARIELSLDAGESFFVVVDAEFSGSTGPTQLNINPMGFTWDVDLGTATGTAISTDSNIGAGDYLTPSCEISTGEEIVYRWEAPSDGCWTLDAVGSTIDTTLMLMDNSTACPVEDDCDASSGSDGTSGAVSVQALAGDEYYVVADAASSSEQGDVQMNVTSGSSLPTDGDLASNMGPAVFTGTLLVTDGSDLSATCGSSSNNVDLVYSWTAPAAATYDFSLAGSGYDTVISLHDGCSGSQHSCNDDFGGTLQSQTSLAMTAGEEVLIRVSGYSTATGTYTLGIYTNSEVVCDDGVDEDQDGLTDCDDTDCASDAACGGSSGS
jgi:hypothetical protein